MIITKCLQTIICAIALAIAGPLMGCSMANSDDVNSIQYFRSFSGYSLPLNPIDHISKEVAESERSYCVAYLENGRLVRLVKFLDGSMFFDHHYAYHLNGKLMRAEVENRNGQVNVLEFDESGALKKE